MCCALAGIVKEIFIDQQIMIRALRKKHVRIWVSVLAVIPALVTMAMFMRPQLPAAHVKKEESDFRFTVATAKELTSVTISLMQPLKAASCLVVLKANGKETILGKITNVGDYTFGIHQRIISSDATIQLIDFVRNKEIASYRIEQ